MNLVGKIFTVMILVMSLVFMSFAVAVYATHKNWREVVMLSREDAQGKPVGLKYQLEDLMNQKQELRDLLDKMEVEREKEQHAAREDLLKVKAELEDQTKKNTGLEEDLAAVTKEKLQALTTLDTMSQDNNKLRTEVDTLRQDIRDAEKKRDDKMTELVQKTDNLLQAENQLKMLKERMAQVQLQLSNAKAVLDLYKLPDDPKGPRQRGRVGYCSGGAGRRPVRDFRRYRRRPEQGSLFADLPC